MYRKKVSFFATVLALFTIGTMAAGASTPNQWAIAGGGFINSSMGRLYFVSNSGDSGQFSHYMFDISAPSGMTLAKNLTCSSCDWNVQSKTLTIHGTVNWKGSDAPIMITVTQGSSQLHSVFKATITPSTGNVVTISDQTSGYLYLVAK